MATSTPEDVYDIIFLDKSILDGALLLDIDIHLRCI